MEGVLAEVEAGFAALVDGADAVPSFAGEGSVSVFGGVFDRL